MSGEAMKLYRSERQIPARYELTLLVATDIDKLSDCERAHMESAMQASLDRMIRDVMYNGTAAKSIAQSRGNP